MFESHKKTIIMRLLKLANIVVNILLFCGFIYVACNSNLLTRNTLQKYATFSVIYFLIYIWMVRVYRSFSVGYSRVGELLYSLALANSITSILVYVILVGYLRAFVNPVYLLALFIAQIACNLLWSLVANRVYFNIHKAKRTVIVYRNEQDLQKLEQIKYFAQKYNVIKRIKNPTNIEPLLEELSDAEVVFVSGVNATLRNGIAKYCIENSIMGCIQPKVGDVIMRGGKMMQMFSVPIIRVVRAKPDAEYLLAKRLFDILISAITLVLVSPFMLGTAIAIKLHDGGPVLYKQIRLTKDRREFEILKFRSMRVDAEKDGVARLATENDDRITPVGHFIRATRFDELPQLINILRGDMSIVGPRPERPEIAAQYEENMPAFGLRLQVQAGLTGYAQVYGRYNTEPYDKLEMDLIYINKMSIAMDLWLMFATVKILFLKESTHGVEEGKVTARK